MVLFDHWLSGKFFGFAMCRAEVAPLAAVPSQATTQTFAERISEIANDDFGDVRHGAQAFSSCNMGYAILTSLGQDLFGDEDMLSFAGSMLGDSDADAPLTPLDPALLDEVYGPSDDAHEVLLDEDSPSPAPSLEVSEVPSTCTVSCVEHNPPLPPKGSVFNIFCYTNNECSIFVVNCNKTSIFFMCGMEPAFLVFACVVTNMLSFRNPPRQSRSANNLAAMGG